MATVWYPTRTRKWSPPWLPGDHVRSGSVVAIARAMPMERPATPIVIIVIIHMQHIYLYIIIDGTAFSIFANEENNNNR